MKNIAVLLMPMLIIAFISIDSIAGKNACSNTTNYVASLTLYSDGKSVPLKVRKCQCLKNSEFGKLGKAITKIDPKGDCFYIYLSNDCTGGTIGKVTAENGNGNNLQKAYTGIYKNLGSLEPCYTGGPL